MVMEATRKRPIPVGDILTRTFGDERVSVDAAASASVRDRGREAAIGLGRGLVAHVGVAAEGGEGDGAGTGVAAVAGVGGEAGDEGRFSGGVVFVLCCLLLHAMGIVWTAEVAGVFVDDEAGRASDCGGGEGSTGTGVGTAGLAFGDTDGVSDGVAAEDGGGAFAGGWAVFFRWDGGKGGEIVHPEAGVA